jgi:hypothetical protein
MASTGNTYHTRRPLSMQGAAVGTCPLTNHGCSAVKMVGSADAVNLPEEMDGLLRAFGMSSGRHLGEAG